MSNFPNFGTTSPTQQGGFGQPSAFGFPPASPGGFGQPSAFVQVPPSPGGFGQQSPLPFGSQLPTSPIQGGFAPPTGPVQYDLATAMGQLNIYDPGSASRGGDEDDDEAYDTQSDPVIAAIQSKYPQPEDAMTAEDIAKIEVPDWLAPYVANTIEELMAPAPTMGGRKLVRIPRIQVPHIIRLVNSFLGGAGTMDITDPTTGQTQTIQIERASINMNTTPTGGGKTLHTLFLAQQFGMRIGIICPNNAKVTWINKCNEYGFQPLFLLGDREIIGRGDGPVKHGFLFRRNEGSEKKKDIKYYPTQAFLNIINKSEYMQLADMQRTLDQTRAMVVAPDQEAARQQWIANRIAEMERLDQHLSNNKFLLIIDEAHVIKNRDSLVWKACAAMEKAINEDPATYNRTTLLSATMFDKPEHAESYMRFCGMIKSEKLYNFIGSTGETQYLGIQELIDNCNRINPQVTADVLALYPLERGSKQTERMRMLVYYLFVCVVKTFISSTGPSPVAPDNVANGYFDLGPRYSRDYDAAATALEETLGVSYDPVSGEARLNNQKVGLGTISPTLKALENSIAYSMARVAHDYLMANPTGKIVLAVHYNDARQLLAEWLKGYNPMQICGCAPYNKLENRMAAINAFQNNPQVRVMIINAISGGVSVDLHDIHGGQPRLMLISPFSYRFINVLQTLGRIWRVGLKSRAMAVMFYGAGTKEVFKIMSAYARKGQTTKSTLTGDAASRSKYPADFPEMSEEQVKAEWPNLLLPLPRDEVIPVAQVPAAQFELA